QGSLPGVVAFGLGKKAAIFAAIGLMRSGQITLSTPLHCIGLRTKIVLPGLLGSGTSCPVAGSYMVINWPLAFLYWLKSPRRNASGGTRRPAWWGFGWR